jgi:hypothetical protein
MSRGIYHVTQSNPELMETYNLPMAKWKSMTHSLLVRNSYNSRDGEPYASDASVNGTGPIAGL